MSPVFRRLRADFPAEFLAALAIAAVFAVLIVLDQAHWWRLKPEYMFGWLVPFFVGFVLLERWPHLKAAMRGEGGSPLPSGARLAVRFGFALTMAVGAVFFLLGALYRAGSGVTQPGSLALAIGFAGLLLGLIYFNVPAGRVGAAAPGGFWRAVGADAQLQAVALFVFPALIWMISAPLVDAVENQLSLFLLRRVVQAVSLSFNMLGYPIVQEGSTLLLPNDERVGVEDACSGIRSLTACLFTGAFLAAVFLDRWWKKIVLIGAALALAVVTNLMRSVFLTAWAYSHGAAAINGTFHDATGYAVLGLTFVGLLCLLPLFKRANWLRWLRPRGAKTEPATEAKAE
ncbi:MAG TPA: exosortase/archaeosortase family protein [Opitutaceae bacterium]|nr:exosortase/archaeosortase family protein [Opitutaceae bacterium]